MSQPANDDFSQHLSDDEASYHEDASENGTATNKPKQQQQQLIPTATTISNIKLLILKNEEYDIWAIKDGVVRILPPVSAAEIHAVEKERKARTILLMAIPKEQMQKAVLKQHWKPMVPKYQLRMQITSFSDLCPQLEQLLLQLEAHGAEVSTEDANHNFLPSLPPTLVKSAMYKENQT
ncbi:hypothetical protein Tco_0618755 [Tanacetum coccineum]